MSRSSGCCCSLLQPQFKTAPQGFGLGPDSLPSRSSRASGRHPPSRRQAITSAITGRLSRPRSRDGDGGRRWRPYRNLKQVSPAAWSPGVSRARWGRSRKVSKNQVVWPECTSAGWRQPSPQAEVPSGSSPPTISFASRRVDPGVPTRPAVGAAVAWPTVADSDRKGRRRSAADLL